ncbi:hypothetical protein J8N05_37485 [Streptomyces sp. BH-SS-21]|uniref:Lipoprotein n=1 Tax=Streptomyces liliiviolaceus TaxID=2823109 RepID=A0A940Y1B8_9ACTN|nr:hypothetical protein [Streptomyces liliiviolaceus]MBQ0853861.1 hypothetical protein [Streptomyces liliiviolaceus]
MRRRSIAATVTIVAAATAAALTGCAADSRGQEPGTSPRSTNEVRELTRAEQGKVEHAEERLIQQCMRRQGLDYRVVPRVDADTDRAFSYRLVWDDVAWARKHGYGERLRRAFFEERERGQAVSPGKALSSAERERFATALQGPSDTPMLSVRLPAGGTVRSPNGGCTRTARDELYGDARAFFHADKIATNLSAVYMPRLMRDPRFTAALKAWSRCMRSETGRVYADPEAARADAQKRSEGLSDERAHAVAVGIAVAEAECARGITLHSTLVRLDGEYGAPVRERYAEEIADDRRMKLTALRRADRLEAGAGAR